MDFRSAIQSGPDAIGNFLDRFTRSGYSANQFLIQV